MLIDDRVYSITMNSGRRYTFQTSLHRLLSFLLLPVTIAIFYTFFGGSLITFDGNQYLATANSIMHFSITQGYLFGRPPGYPIFLAFLLSISRSDRFLIFIQVFLIASSTLLLMKRIDFLLKKIFQFGIPKWIIYLLVFLPTIDGYGTTVLQQPLFIAETNLGLFLLLSILIESSNLSNYFYVGVLSVIAVWTGEGIIPFFACVIALALYLIMKSPELVSSKKILLTILILLSGLCAITSLSLFQNWGESRPNTITYGVPQGSDVLEYPKFFAHSPLIALSDFFDDYVTQSGLAPAVQTKGLLGVSQSNPMFENRVHAEATFSVSRKCGITDSYNSGTWSRFARGSIVQSCAKFTLAPFLTGLSFTVGVFVSFISFIYIPLGLLLISTVRRKSEQGQLRFLVILVVPAAVLRLAYLLLGFQPDRYVVQFLPESLLISLIGYAMFRNVTDATKLRPSKAKNLKR